MKKLFTLVVIALTTLTISAQKDRNLTVKIGVGSGTIVGSDAKKVKSAISFKIGASYDIALGDNFYIIPGIEIVDKGFKDKTWEGAVDREYIQIPVFAGYKFDLSEPVKLTVKAGPYMAYGIGGTSITFNNFTTGYSYKRKVFDEFHRFDAGIIAGVSLDIKRFVIGAEYSRGLTHVMSGGSGYNQVFGGVVGYRF